MAKSLVSRGVEVFTGRLETESLVDRGALFAYGLGENLLRLLKKFWVNFFQVSVKLMLGLGLVHIFGSGDAYFYTGYLRTHMRITRPWRGSRKSL